MKARLVLMLLALPGICMASVSALAQKDITNTTSVVKSSKKLLSPKAPLNVLIESLHSEDGNTRNRALSFIGSRGPEAKAAVPALIDNLENGLMVELTLHVIGKIGTNAVEAIPVLFKSITAYPRQPATRHCAAQALVNIGDAAVPTLKKGVGSDNIY